MTTFYDGLDEQNCTLLDASCGGSVMSKSYNFIYALLKKMTANGRKSQRKPHGRKNAGVYEIDQMAAMSATLESLTKKMDNLVKVAFIQSPEYQCELCEGNHATESCTNNPICVNFVGN